MDGVRARRQKSGSPLGRIIDEALDITQQACYSLWLGYLFNFDCLFFELLMVMANVTFFSMEMRFILSKSLTMNVGEIGPVEIELILTSILLVGYYFSGVSMFQ